MRESDEVWSSSSFTAGLNHCTSPHLILPYPVHSLIGRIARLPLHDSAAVPHCGMGRRARCLGPVGGMIFVSCQNDGCAVWRSASTQYLMLALACFSLPGSGGQLQPASRPAKR